MHRLRSKRREKRSDEQLKRSETELRRDAWYTKIYSKGSERKSSRQRRRRKSLSAKRERKKQKRGSEGDMMTLKMKIVDELKFW